MASQGLAGSTYCSGSLEPEYSCHDRDWIMELPMEADILTFTGILTPEDASVASCSPLISRSKLLRSSTRMRLPILNSVRAWTRLFHVSASRGLRPIAAEPQSAQGGTMEQSSRWAKICHFDEVGHWSRSLAAFFFRKFLGDLRDVLLQCELRRTFAVRNPSSTITFTQDT